MIIIQSDNTYLQRYRFKGEHSYKHIANDAEISIQDEKHCRSWHGPSPYARYLIVKRQCPIIIQDAYIVELF